MRYTVTTLIAGLLGLAFGAAGAASFDCAKASNRIENAICKSSILSNLDEELAKSYAKATSSGNDPEGVKRAQREWLRNTRNQCQSEDCLVSAYKQQLIALASFTTLPSAEVVMGNGNKVVAAGRSKKTLSERGYKRIFDSPDGQSWWRRVPDKDRNGWRYAAGVELNGASESSEAPLWIKCRDRKMGMPLGPKDDDVQWVQVDPNSNMAAVIAYVCDGGDGQSSKSNAVGSQLDPNDISVLYDLRLGRCAARSAFHKHYDTAEVILGEAKDRKLARSTYAALLIESQSNSSEAESKWRDACYALGFSGKDGGKADPKLLEAASAEFEAKLTPFEIANPNLQPKSAKQSAYALADSARAANEAEQRRLAADDPVTKLVAAYEGANVVCRAAYKAAVADAVRMAAKLRKEAENVPEWRGDLRNPSEQAARSQANTVLSGMRSNGCTKIQ